MNTSTESTLVCTDSDPVPTTTGAGGVAGSGCAGVGCPVVVGEGGGTLGQNAIRRMISRSTPTPAPARIFCWLVSRCKSPAAATGDLVGVALTLAVGTRGAGATFGGAGFLTTSTSGGASLLHIMVLAGSGASDSRSGSGAGGSGFLATFL